MAEHAERAHAEAANNVLLSYRKLPCQPYSCEGWPFLCDFCVSSKCVFINFFIASLIFDTSEYSTYQLITHSVNHTHFIFTLLNFSLR
jgi:hypothetical protein